MNDRTSQDTTYQNIINKQEATEITGDINTLRKSIKGDSTFTDAKLSESVGTIVERINRANHLPDDTKTISKRFNCCNSTGKKFKRIRYS